MKKTIIFLSMLFISCIMNAQTVKIGKQIWMTNNLDVVTFRNGDTIPQLKTEEEWEKASKLELPAWCYYNYDPVNGTKYGKLYNWFAVNDSRGLAPKGYHVPTESEWAKMIDFLGGSNSNQLLRTQSGVTRILAQNVQTLQFRRLSSDPKTLEVSMVGQKNTLNGRTINYQLAFDIQLRN